MSPPQSSPKAAAVNHCPLMMVAAMKIAAAIAAATKGWDDDGWGMSTSTSSWKGAGKLQYGKSDWSSGKGGDSWKGSDGWGGKDWSGKGDGWSKGSDSWKGDWSGKGDSWGLTYYVPVDAAGEEAVKQAV